MTRKTILNDAHRALGAALMEALKASGEGMSDASR